MKRIAVVTSGGDAPGINAAIRAIVRTAIYRGLQVWGIQRGFQGMIEGEIREMPITSVGGIIHRGGTILRTIRSEEFKTQEGQVKAVNNLKKQKIEGLIVIGGNGSFHGAYSLDSVWNIPTIGIPATIDNDIWGTDETIGFDTAVNTALEAINKIRDTAFSHERIFVIEVMGRERGFLALQVGLVGGAEVIIIPEVKYDINKLCQRMREGYQRGKTSCIIVVAEGAERASYLATEIEARTKFEARVSILGYIQRGGTPTARSCLLASRFGTQAVELLIKGERGKTVGIQGGNLISVSLEKSYKEYKPIDLELYQLAEILSL